MFTSWERKFDLDLELLYILRSSPICPYRIYTRLIDRRESKLLWNSEPTIGKHDSYEYTPFCP